MMMIVRSAIAGSVLLGATSCGGSRAAAPSMPAPESSDASTVASAVQMSPAPQITGTSATAETYQPWSDGMGETAPNRFVETNGIRFAYRAFGRKPGVPIVFLAPLGRNMDFWDPKLTDALAQGHLVVLFDNAGVGLSSGESPRTVAEIAKNAEAFIDGLKELHMTDSDWVNGRIDLLGFSFGGVVAQQFALDRPDLAERVVLAGTAPQGGDNVGARSLEAAKREPATPHNSADDLLALFFAQSETSKAAGRAFITRIDGRKTDRDAPVTSKTIAAQAAAAKDWRGMSKGGSSYLTGLKQHVLVADGVADVAVPKNSLVLAEALPNAELVVYPDSAQGFLFQYPERFAEHVSTFLRRP